MMDASTGLRERVEDFYRTFAPQDASKVSIVLSMGLKPEDVIPLLSAKYNVASSKSRTRSWMMDKAASRFRAHGVGEPFQAAFHLLADVPALKELDDGTLASLVDRSVRGAAAAAPSSPLSAGLTASSNNGTTPLTQHVELSPVHQHSLLRYHQGPSSSATASSNQPFHVGGGGYEPLPQPSIASQLPTPYPKREAPATLQQSRTSFAPTASLTDAHQIKSAVTSYLERHQESSRPALPAGLVDLSQQGPLDDPSVRRYHKKLVEVEAQLMRWCVELQQIQEHTTKRTHDVGEREIRVREAEQHSKSTMEQQSGKLQAKEIELAESAARLAADREHWNDLSSRQQQQQRHLDAQLSAVEEREAKVAASTQNIAAREAALAAQMKLIESEKSLCQKLSTEVLRREGIVRNAEKQLAAAKTELTRLEDELSGRAKQVIDDEASLRRWATEVEKRELTVQSIFEQLRHKGIHVSY